MDEIRKMYSKRDILLTLNRKLKPSLYSLSTFPEMKGGTDDIQEFTFFKI